MSEPRKLEPHEAYDVLERIAMRDEAERIAALDEAGLARELAGAGRTLEGERAKGQALVERLRSRAGPALAVAVAAAAQSERQIEPAPDSERFDPRARTPSGFRARSQSRRSTIVWLLAAALAMVGAVAFVERDAIVARFKPQPVPIEPVPSEEMTPPRPSPEEAAVALRHDATQTCREMNLELCERQLDEAKKLDPAGENTPAVMSLRTFIYMKRLPPAPRDDPFGKGVSPKAPKGK
jgi:hypothetical protein